MTTQAFPDLWNNNDVMYTNANITRVEVIDETGRAYVRLGVSATVSIQDEGRTLKLFVRPHPSVSPDDVQNSLSEGLKEWTKSL